MKSCSHVQPGIWDSALLEEFPNSFWDALAHPVYWSALLELSMVMPVLLPGTAVSSGCLSGVTLVSLCQGLLSTCFIYHLK